MVMKRVERGQLYFNSGLIAEAETFDMNIENGDELAHATDGSHYHTIGNLNGTATPKLIVPVDGSGKSATLLAATLNHTDFTLTAFVDGQFIEAPGFCTKASYNSDAKSGKLMFDSSISFGEPKPLTG